MTAIDGVIQRAGVLALVVLAACRFGFDATAGDAASADATVITGSRVQSVASDSDFSTTSATFVDVPGATLTVTPDAPTQAWVLIVSAGFSSLANEEVAAEVRYTVDGVERGYGGVQSIEPDDISAFTTFDLFTDGAAHTIQLQLRDVQSTGATVTDYRVVAFSLPTDAEVWFADDATTQDVLLSSFSTYLTLDVSPSAPGDYLVLGAVTATEAPNASNVALRLRDPSGAQWPTTIDYFNHRQDWYGFLWARTLRLETAGTFALDARGNAPATLRLARIAAIRTDAFEAVASSMTLPSQSSMSTTPVVLTTLTTPTPPAERDHVVLHHIGLEVNLSTFDHGAVFRRDGMERGRYHFNTETPGATPGIVEVVRTASAMTLDNACYISDSTADVQCYESVIHALRLKP